MPGAELTVFCPEIGTLLATPEACRKLATRLVWSELPPGPQQRISETISSHHDLFSSCWISLHFSSLRLLFAKWQHFAETLCPSWRSASSPILRLSRKSAERFEVIGDRGSRYQQVNRLRYKQTIWKMAVQQLLPVRTNKIFKQNGAFNNKPPSKILQWLVPLYHFGTYFSASVTLSLRALA